MTNEERENAIKVIRNFDLNNPKVNSLLFSAEEITNAFDMAIKALEQQPCEMTTEEYRQRMIQAFHNADTDELIAVCVLPTEKEFEHMEWLLKNHYKKDPCEESEDKTE